MQQVQFLQFVFAVVEFQASVPVEWWMIIFIIIMDVIISIENFWCEFKTSPPHPQRLILLMFKDDVVGKEPELGVMDVVVVNLNTGYFHLCRDGDVFSVVRVSSGLDDVVVLGDERSLAFMSV